MGGSASKTPSGVELGSPGPPTFVKMGEQREEKIKYFLYARKSEEQEERQILSIGSQIKELRERFGELDIVDVLRESASAFKPYNRPVFAKMMERIKRDEAHGIVAWSPDRLSRNPIDGGQIIYFLDTGDLFDLKFADYHFDHSPTGKMMLGMAFSQSKFSSDKLSVDVKRGLKAKAEKGWLPGVAPTGYINNSYKNMGEKDISPDPERFHLLRKAIDLVLSGNYTPIQALGVLNDDWGFKTLKRKHIGGVPLNRSIWYHILTNPFYYGEFKFNGKMYKGKHEPMIIEEEFWRIQDILGKKGRRRARTHRFAFSGMIRCAKCGNLLVFDRKTKYYKGTNRTAHYTYAYCTGRKRGECDQPGIELGALEKQIVETLTAITIPEEFKNWALKYLKEVNAWEVKDRKTIHESLQRSYNETQGKLDRLVDLRINEEVEKEEYLQKRAELKEELSQLKSKLESTEKRSVGWLELTERTFEFATHARYWFENGNLQEKREILSAISSNLLIDDRTLKITLIKPFAILNEGLDKQETLEPMKIPTVMEENPDLRPQNMKWLPG